jgi:hypothetical protein
MQQQNKITGWLNKRFKVLVAVILVSMQPLLMNPVRAATGEMGKGVVSSFGLYGQNLYGVNPVVIVWGLTSPSIPFPAGCNSLFLTATTMGMDAFKTAVGILTAAQLAGKPVRFWAHAERDGGCGVDYVQLG